jgi:hypothetical protein
MHQIINSNFLPNIINKNKNTLNITFYFFHHIELYSIKIENEYNECF